MPRVAVAGGAGDRAGEPGAAARRSGRGAQKDAVAGRITDERGAVDRLDGSPASETRASTVLERVGVREQHLVVPQADRTGAGREPPRLFQMFRPM